MQVEIFKTKGELGAKAGADAGEQILKTIEEQGFANIILATGASQFEILKHLIHYPGIDWSKVAMFHLDEYIGLPETHNASFRKFLKERFVSKVEGLTNVVFINGDSKDPNQEIRRINEIISNFPIDLAFVGIGENGHLAFNDPPADFETEDPYLIVDLDEKCRKQQLGEGWFGSLKEVPARAISMSVKQIMKSKRIICSVPDKRKAEAVKNCLESEITNLHPASILQEHTNCTIYLDKESSSLLSK
ncbi:MAG: glucosamine-6-phosphate deaminase [Bacteroidales bacterium]|nr:glucosamine-6-phosphate deaminase [Bacteroidales bacterium]